MEVPRRVWLNVGLFLATLATLLLETLDARLLSVITWYHLSFFAVSLAMLGMAGGAVFVFLDRERFTPERGPASLARVTFAFACAIPASHLVNLCLPFLTLATFSLQELLSIAVSTVTLAVPFVLSGIAVTAALTRSGGRVGRLYASDLLGAATGCAVVVPVLDHTNITSAVFLSGAAAAAAAAAFYRSANARGAWRSAVVCLVLLAVTAINTAAPHRLDVLYPKNRQLWLNTDADLTAWNSHSYVIIQRPHNEPAFFWGGGRGVESYRSEIAWLAIDGEAGTPITKWDGNVAALDWVSHDVTTLPYVLRQDSDAAVIGVGGGRDLLSALWGHSRSVVGIEVNKIIIDALTGSHRAFAGVANRPEVRLVHDDGRAYLTRTPERFDVIQMSLVDTWAATGAGAFTLSENGLYTLEAWRMFLDRLKPGGILSVSRWFDPGNLSETNRLLALAASALIGRQAGPPIDQLILAVRGRVATLMVSNQPFTVSDREALGRAAAANEFDVVVSPWLGGPARSRRIDRIVRSRTLADLARATEDPSFDFSPPTDARPYYFNMLKPSAFAKALEVPKGGIFWGNLRATVTLLALLVIATGLVIAIIVWPLARTERPAMPPGQFVTAMTFFGTIGFAYMLIQIAFLQRFSVYLGHPTYSLAITLFAMLLFTGVGSLASERLRGDGAAGFWWVALAASAALVATAGLIPGVLQRTVSLGLAGRSAIVLLFTVPVSALIGCCFPIGARLVRTTPTLLAWAWGVNGACGVLASIGAVAVSMWIGIDANLWAAAILYLLLVVPLVRMPRWLQGVPEASVSR